MIKSILILVSISILSFSSEQIVLVVSQDFNSSMAQMEYFQGSTLVGTEIEVNIGKNGLGWGLGVIQFIQKTFEPLKYEGDNKAPIGVFKLTSIFGYASENHYKMPYFHASKNLICVDDSDSPDYNNLIIANGDEKSFEYMRRKDTQYKVGIVVEHNKNAQKRRGSCIFIHVQKGDNKPTSGCTSMKEDEIIKLVNWLDKSKNPILIQIPKSYAKEVLKLYPELKNSKLLKEED